MTKDERIKAHLQSGKIITPEIAVRRYRCHALHSAIHRLRDKGMKIRTRIVRKGREWWGEYSMGRR